VEADVRQEVDRRVEQNRSLDALRLERRQLQDEPPAEGVADPRRALDSRSGDRLEHVGGVGGDRPRRLPLREAVPAKVRGENAEAALEPLLGEAAEAPAVAGDAVEADDRRGVAIAPLV